MLHMLRIMLMLAVLSGRALASDQRPAEEPPADFAARQYIDSRGCVFLRDDSGRGWTPRLSRDGSGICGYPPTLSVRGLGGQPRLRALAPPVRDKSELLAEALNERIMTELRPGELASDPTPMEKLPDMGPEPASQAPLVALRAAIKAAPAVRQGTAAALKPNHRLCELLGYNKDQGDVASSARDPSQGYCDSLPATDLSRLAFARPVTSIDKDEPAASVPATPVTQGRVGQPAANAATAVQPARRTATVPETSGHGNKRPDVDATSAGRGAVRTIAALKPASKPEPVSTPRVKRMIPAGARYIQLGTYMNADNAERTARRVSQMGYPVARGGDRVRGRKAQVIMAGPFGDRQSIVRAMDTIRKAGFDDAFPR